MVKFRTGSTDNRSVAELTRPIGPCGPGTTSNVLRGINTASVDWSTRTHRSTPTGITRLPLAVKRPGAAFRDTWTLSDVDEAWHGEISEQAPPVYAAIDNAGIIHGKRMKSYLIMMAVRLLELRRVIKPRDRSPALRPTANSYLRLLCDAVFGAANFQNEIVWKRTSSHNRAKRWGPVHDVTPVLFQKR